jgi:hypothetical protein
MPNGRCAAAVYFIMGRSDNSRNRVFVETEDGIKTRAFDEASMRDPGLVIYHPVRRAGGSVIVTNGDQTDTIAEHLRSGKTFESALRAREFEPDPPIYTPRISGIIYPDGAYKLSILKSAEGNGALCLRQFFEYDAPICGLGHIIHTYFDDGDPVPSFIGEPAAVSVYADIEEFTRAIWDNLDEDNKISIFGLEFNASTGKTKSVIINKHKR